MAAPPHGNGIPIIRTRREISQLPALLFHFLFGFIVGSLESSQKRIAAAIIHPETPSYS
jgi:hypothetical protein